MTATTANVRRIMHTLEAQHPGQRELSLFASVELSLQRLSPEVRGQIAGLAVFQGGGYTFAHVLGVNSEQNTKIIMELIEVGLAQPIGEYGYIRLDPALPAYLDLGLTAEQREGYRQRWREVMGQLVDFLYEQRFQNTQLAAKLTQLELPNIMAYLQTLVEGLQIGQVAPEQLVDKAGSIEQLLANLHHPQELMQIVAWRKQAAKAIGEWSHACFENERMNIERLLQQGNAQTAYQEAKILLDRCQQAGKQAYPRADYDLAMAYSSIGQALRKLGAMSDAVQYLQQAQNSFKQQGERGAQMVANTLLEEGICLQALGHLDASISAYEESIHWKEKLGNIRGIAIAKGNIATTRLHQKYYADALHGYKEALEMFQQLGEPDTIAIAWHQIGMTYRHSGEYLQAEQAYRQSLSIKSKQNNHIGEANTLNELGQLYDDWNRPEQAVHFYRQAADIYAVGDFHSEGVARSNLANIMIKLKCYEEARPELLRAFECKQAFGHAAEPWKTWDILHALEQANGNPQAAREARQQALTAFLTYRRDGGENHESGGRLALTVGLAIQHGDTTEVEHVIGQLLEREDTPINFLHKLQAIIAEGRDLALAEDESLPYDLAVEILLLLEGLQATGM